MSNIFNVDSEIITITGKITHYLFHNEENLYTVAKIRLHDLEEKTTTIVGYLPKSLKGELFEFSGNYKDNPRYGIQFVVSSYKKSDLTTFDSLVRYLSSQLFPTIGSKFAVTIVETLGLDLITKVKENPGILFEVEKMTLKKQQIIKDGIMQEEEDLNSFLQAHQIGIRNILKIQQVYGEEGYKIIKNNPYRLVEDIDGIGFKIADKLANSIGFPTDSPFRIQAYILSYLIEFSMRTGSTFILKEELLQFLKNELSNEEMLYMLEELADRKQVFVEENRIYHHSQYKAEEYIAKFIREFIVGEVQCIDVEYFTQLVNEVQEEYGIEYDDIQRMGILSSLQSNAMILTGGPGTGKTTVVKAIVNILTKLFPNNLSVLCAPTGRAAKRLNELTGVESSTIHSVLKWNLETNTFGKNINDPLVYDCIIVDECSMVDNWLMYNLLLACKNVKKIIFIGDRNQLPSVGPGALLRDLIKSDLLPVIQLDKIYRQKEGSEIIELAHSILNEEEEFFFESEVKFLKCENHEIRNVIASVVNQAINKNYDIQDVQVLSCKYDGMSGIDNLNLILQNQFNPESEMKKELRHGNRIFREHDKILQLKNLNDQNVYNGDIGSICEIELNTPKYRSKLMGNFDGNFVEYDYESLNKLTLAYCISIHKSQGSEYPIVIIPFSKNDAYMLTKRLIYTAVTRCSKSLILVGDYRLFLNSIKKIDRDERKSTLVERLLFIN